MSVRSGLAMRRGPSPLCSGGWLGLTVGRRENVTSDTVMVYAPHPVKHSFVLIVRTS